MNKELNFSNLSIELTKQITKEVKKENGIYFTPKPIIKCLIEKIPFSKIKRILEPSCGSCEFISFLDNYKENIIIDAIENNKIIYDKIKTLKFTNEVNIINNDFTKINTEQKYDLIIGNPPYFVCNKNTVPIEYSKIIVGRPNIFCIFILHSLQLLEDDGIIAFILPNSFLNSVYYSSIREQLLENGNIIEIINFEKEKTFMDTQQPIIGLIFQKTKNKIIQEYSFQIEKNTIFTSNINKLKNLFVGSTTLQKLGLNVKTGNIIWNEKKELLTNDDSKTILIYNSNITKKNEFNKMDFTNNEKKQYIDLQGFTKLKIVVNRGNGNSTYKFTYSIIQLEHPYLVENHLNVIEPNDYNEFSSSELLELYEKIIKSFSNPKTLEFIQEFLGNNSLSKTELLTIFPIYL